MSHLVDTNVLSELARMNPNDGVTDWFRQQSGFYLSVVAVEELEYGLTWRPNDRVRTLLELLIARHATVMPVSQAIAELAGRLRGKLQKEGETRHQADMLIAATALQHKLILVTRNEKDFAGIDLSSFNPFK